MSITSDSPILLETSEIFQYKLRLLDDLKSAHYEYDLARSEVDHVLLLLESLSQSDKVKANIEKLKTNINDARSCLSAIQTVQTYKDAKVCLLSQLEEIKKFAQAEAEAFVESRKAADAEKDSRRKILEAKMRRESLLRIRETKEQTLLTEVGEDLLSLIPSAQDLFNKSTTQLEASKPDWEAALQREKTQPELTLQKIEASILLVNLSIELLKQTRQEYNTAIKKIQKSDEKSDILERMDSLLKQVESSEYLSIPDKNDFKSKISAVQLDAFKKTTTDDLILVRANLVSCANQFTNLQEQRKADNTTIQSRMSDLQQRFEKVLLYTDAKQLGPVGEGLRTAKELLGMWKIDEVKTALDQVDTALKELEQDAGNLERKEMWDKKMADLLTVKEGASNPAIVEDIERLKAAGDSNSALKGVAEQAMLIGVEYETLINQAFFEPEQFSDYLDDIQRIEQRLENLKKSYAEINNIKVDLGNHQQSKDTAVNKIALALITLSESIPPVIADAAGQVRKPFEDKRDVLVAKWDKYCKSGLNESTIQFLQDVLLELDNLEKDILQEVESYKRSENTLTPQFEILQGKQLQQDIFALQAKCDDVANELVLFGFTPTGITDKLARDASMDSTPSVLEPIKVQMAERLQYLTSELEQKRKTFHQQQQDAIRLFTAIKTSVQTLRSAVEEYESSWKFWQTSKKQFLKIAEVVSKELDALDGSIHSDVELVFSDAYAALPKLQELILQAQRDFEGTEEEPKNAELSLTFITAKLNTCEETIEKDQPLKERNPKQQAEFLEGVKGLLEKVGEVMPGKISEDLQSLENDYKKESTIAKQESDYFPQFEGGYLYMLKQLEDEKSQAFANHEEYYGKLLGGLKQAQTTAKVHGMLEQAKSLLQQYTTEINLVLNDGAKLTENSNRVHEANEQNKLHQVEWNAKIEAFNREEFQRLKDAVAEQQSNLEAFSAFFFTPEKLTEVQTLRDQALEAAKKGDFEMALFRLSDAKSRAQFHLDFPDGSATKQLADITAIKKVWRDAVDKYHQDLQNVCTGIEKYLTEQGEADGANKVKNNASQLTTLFAKPVFDGCVQRLSAPDQDGASARADVKEGLAEVRRLRELLTDGRIMQLHKHPFESVDTFKGHYHIGKALVDIEKTLLMANGRD